VELLKYLDQNIPLLNSNKTNNTLYINATYTV